MLFWGIVVMLGGAVVRTGTNLSGLKTYQLRLLLHGLLVSERIKHAELTEPVLILSFRLSQSTVVTDGLGT